MERQGQSFDLSNVSTADKIVLGGAVAFIIWTFLPVWYNCCSVLGISADVGSVSGFRGTIIISWLLALVSVVEIVITKIIGTEMKMPLRRGQLHLAIAVVALLFTLLGFIAKSTGLTIGWGIFVGLLLNLAWAYGAYMMYSEPAPAPPAGGMGMG